MSFRRRQSNQASVNNNPDPVARNTRARRRLSRDTTETNSTEVNLNEADLVYTVHTERAGSRVRRRSASPTLQKRGCVRPPRRRGSPASAPPSSTPATNTTTTNNPTSDHATTEVLSDNQPTLQPRLPSEDATANDSGIVHPPTEQAIREDLEMDNLPAVVLNGPATDFAGVNQALQQTDQPNETAVDEFATLVIQTLSQRVLEYITQQAADRPGEESIGSLIQRVIRRLLEESFSQPGGGPIGHRITRISEDHREVIIAQIQQDANQPAQQRHNVLQASAQECPSSCSSGTSSTSVEPRSSSTASAGSPDQQLAGVALQENQQDTAARYPVARRMILERGTVDGDQWQTVGHVDWVYNGGRTQQCLYHTVTDARTPVYPGQHTVIDYILDAQRILLANSERANQADNDGLETVQV